jgi:hypothetical protein
VPQGINPNILILQLKATPPPGPVPQILTRIPLRYEEAPPSHPYTQVTVRNGTEEFTIGVGVTH